MMKPLIIANWKMNPSNSQEAFDLASAVQSGLQGVGVDVVLCPPFVYLQGLISAPAFAKGYGGLAFGSQDCFWEEEGAFTGEVSARMLKNMGCSYVILGHSERKKYLGETLEMVNKKVLAALKAEVIPIVCIGQDVEREMKIVLRDIENWKLKIGNLILVYEPEWAISTNPGGKPATPKGAQVALQKMRALLPKTTTLLYGGSVNSNDIRRFIEAGAAGALVGAASLRAQEFIQLAKNAISR